MKVHSILLAPELGEAGDGWGRVSAFRSRIHEQSAIWIYFFQIQVYVEHQVRKFKVLLPLVRSKLNFAFEEPSYEQPFSEPHSSYHCLFTVIWV